MKLSRLASAAILASAFTSGAVLAQTAPTTPSTTPDESTATPPRNDKVPVGTPAPAPYATNPSGTAPVNLDPDNHLLNERGEPRQPSDVGNTEPTATQGGGAPYANTGKR